MHVTAFTDAEHMSLSVNVCVCTFTYTQHVS